MKLIIVILILILIVILMCEGGEVTLGEVERGSMRVAVTMRCGVSMRDMTKIKIKIKIKNTIKM